MVMSIPHPDEFTPLARQLMAKAPRPLPQYGSLQWFLSPDEVRYAAMAVAAECWRDHCNPLTIAEELIERLEAEDRSVLRRLRETSADVREGLNTYSPGWVDAPSHAELERRRGKPPKKKLPAATQAELDEISDWLDGWGRGH